MTVGSLLYFGLLALWSALVAHFILMRIFPTKEKVVAVEPQPKVVVLTVPRPETPHVVPATYQQVELQLLPNGLNPDEGFKSFQQGAELTVDDIVKGLSRN